MKWNMRRRFPTIVACVGVFALIFALGRYVVRAESTGPGPAFSATILTKHFDSKNTLVQTDTTLYAHKADGSFARDVVSINNRPGDMKTVVSVDSGLRVTADLVGNSKTTYTLGKSVVEGLARAPTCEGNGDVVKILGHTTYHTTSEITHGGGNIHDEEWRAPDLGCFPLKRSYSKWYVGQIVGSTVEEVVSVSVGEPDPRIFDIPPGLTERSPSQAMASRKAAEGKPCNNCARGYRVLDKAYQSHQSN